LRAAWIILIGGIILSTATVYWAVTAGTYICFGGFACQPSFDAWMLQRSLAFAGGIVGIVAVALGTVLLRRNPISTFGDK